MASNSGSEDLDGYIEGPYLLQKSGLRFTQGIGFVPLMTNFWEDRFTLEGQTAQILQDYTCHSTKKLSHVSSEVNGALERGTIYSACTKVLMEPIEEAKIHNLIKNKGLGNDGPVSFLYNLKADMDRSAVPRETVKLYSTAWERQNSVEKDITTAKEYYYMRKYKLEKAKRDLSARPSDIAPLKANKLKKSMDRYMSKCGRAKENYVEFLGAEEAGREKYISDMKKAQEQYEQFEMNRLTATKMAMENCLDVIENLDSERASHQRLLIDTQDLLDNMDIEAEMSILQAPYMKKHSFPVFKEYGNETQISKSEKEVISVDESGNDVAEITLSDGDVDEDQSELELYEYDEYDCEEKVIPMPEPTTPVARETAQRKKRIGRTSIMFRTFLTTGCCCGDSDSWESSGGAEFLAILMRDLSCVSLPDLTQSVDRKQAEKTRKEAAKKKSTVKESIKPSKTTGKTKNEGTHDASFEGLKVKDKVENISSGSSKSSQHTEKPAEEDVRNLANVKVIATENYVAKNTDELTLKAGQKIKQKTPANSDGMAFGWTRKGMLRKKIYGYYPASLVEHKPKKEKSGLRALLSTKTRVMKLTS